MNKSERLNDMLLYLQDKKTFSLKTIMEKYSISKSTALRDIRSLETIGMPIYSKTGRNGFYSILENRLLSPILFTTDEVQALYFSMQTLKSYQSTPFHIDIEDLKNKFESCISEERINMLRQMENVLALESPYNKNKCIYLKQIVQMALDESLCIIRYIKNEQTKEYYIQFFSVTSVYGQWYATGYNFETNKSQVFRCDKIISVNHSKKYCPKQISDFSVTSREIFRQDNAIDFEIGITPKGVDIFHKEHYPSMHLHCQNDKYSIRGFFNKGEEDFISNYLITYSNTITYIIPSTLATLVLEKLDILKQYYHDLYFQTKAT